VTDLDPQTWRFSVKNPVWPEKPVEKSVFNMPAGFFKPRYLESKKSLISLLVCVCYIRARQLYTIDYQQI
jgi:hypothetical protein